MLCSHMIAYCSSLQDSLLLLLQQHALEPQQPVAEILTQKVSLIFTDVTVVKKPPLYQVHTAPKQLFSSSSSGQRYNSSSGHERHAQSRGCDPDVRLASGRLRRARRRRQ